VAAVGELDRIGQKVHENLPKAFFVGPHEDRQVGRLFKIKPEALRSGLHPEHVDDLVEKFVDVDLIGINLQATGLDPGDVEQTVNQT